MGQDQRGRTRVVTPEEKCIAAGQIRGWEIRAKGVAESRISVPVAHMGRGDLVRAPQRIEKTGQPSFRIINRCPAPSPLGQGDCTGAVTLTYSQ